MIALVQKSDLVMKWEWLIRYILYKVGSNLFPENRTVARIQVAQCHLFFSVISIVLPLLSASVQYTRLQCSNAIDFIAIPFVI